MRRTTLSDIAAATGLAAAGRTDIAVDGLAEPAAAGPDHLAIATSPAFEKDLAKGGARAALLAEGADWEALGLEAALFAPRPRVALAKLTGRFAHAPDVAPGIHPAAIVDPAAEIGKGAAIGPGAVIGPGARIGAGAHILALASIGADAVIGEDALIGEGARIGARVSAGARLIVHANAVIGADGFSFVTPERGAVETARQEGRSTAGSDATAYRRIHSLGAVRLGDDVEIGAGTTIDRGTIRDTEIGSGTKIDNLVQIGHNCRVGRTCLLCAQVGMAGSAEIGDRVVLGGKSGVADHIRVGSDVLVAATSSVGTNVPSGTIMMGTPALKRDDWIATNSALRRLPRLARQVGEIRRKLGL